MEPDRYRITLTNTLRDAPLLADAMSIRDLDVEFTSTLEVSPEKYEALIYGRDQDTLYTVEQTIDLNPHHRKVTSGWRASLKRFRDIVSWEFRRRVLRQSVLEEARITIPNCRLTRLSEPV